jgi:hypothetical protein
VTVISLYTFSDIGYLWFNVIGCALVVVLGVALQIVMPRTACA